MKKNQTTSASSADLRRLAEGRLREKQRRQRQEASVRKTAEETERLIHELQVHQIELEMQNEELLRARTDAEAVAERYTDLYDFAPIGYFTLARDGTILQVNLTGARLLGQERSRLVRCRFGLFVSGTDRPVFNAFLDRVFESRSKETCEVSFRAADEENLSLSQLSGGQCTIRAGQRDVRIEGTASEDGSECRVVVGDITERKQAEEELQKLASVVRYSNELVNLAKMDGRMIFLNEAGEKMLGISPAEVAQTTIIQVIPAHLREMIERELLPALQGGGTWSGELQYVNLKTGQLTDVLATTFTVKDQRSGKPQYLANVSTDITERKRAEEERRHLEMQVQQVQKLESLGLLAGGIAHDFNNILTGVLGTVSLAKNIASGRGLAEVVELMTQAEKAGFQARTLTKQLLTFSKGGTPIKRALALGPFLREAVNFALHGSAVRCEFHLDPVLRTIQADADQLSQVIHNLVINAKQAMPGGGSLRISAENANITELPPERRKVERYVKIEVEDKGSGISPDHLPKIFDPYFTTKQEGTGLGLAIVHSIVERHDGFINVKSQLGAGTTFTFFLPACDPDIVQEQPPVEPSRLRGRVLVMDDQEMIRTVCSTMLTVLGCDVSCAKDGAEALAMYREAKTEGRPFDAVIMDLTVPGGMGGEQAIAQLLEMDPAARAIVSSGYASGPAIGDYKRLGFLAAIGKPYTVEELSRVLGQVLSGKEE